MKGMKLEHIRIGKFYMWGDRRVEVRAITDALREGDPESEESDEDLVAGDVVTVAGVDEDGTPCWQYAPFADLRLLPVSMWAEDIRANYAHRYEPDAAPAMVEAALISPQDVPVGSLAYEGEGVDEPYLAHIPCEGGSRFCYLSSHEDWDLAAGS